MKLQLLFDEDGPEGEKLWKCRVYAPNGHYRTTELPFLSETVAKVLKDYGNWIVSHSSLDHLTIEVRPRDRAPGETAQSEGK